MTARNCVYCAAPSEMFTIEVDTSRVDEMPDHAFLCTWADDSPEGVSAMTGAPRWLQRNALAGHLMRPDDCTGCPGFKPRPMLQTKEPLPHRLTEKPNDDAQL